MKTSIMKPKLAILIFDQVEVLDFAGPFEVFSVADELHDFGLLDVFTVSHTTKQIATVNGLKVTADYDFHSCPDDIDYLVIPGGDGTKLLHTSSAYRLWIKTQFDAAQEVLTVCSGIRFLASLGLLTEQPYCTHHEVYAAIKSMAPLALPQYNLRFTRAGKLTSAGGISAGIDAAFDLLARITSGDVAHKTAKYMEYHRNDADRGVDWMNIETPVFTDTTRGILAPI